MGFGVEVGDDRVPLAALLGEVALSGPILVTTVVGLAIFLVAVLLSPETKGKVLVADLTVA